MRMLPGTDEFSLVTRCDVSLQYNNYYYNLLPNKVVSVLIVGTPEGILMKRWSY